MSTELANGTDNVDEDGISQLLAPRRASRPARARADYKEEGGSVSIRKATPLACWNCRSDILIGLDADMCAIDARVDPWPVTRTGELLAVVSGKATYELDIRGNLHRRSRFHLKTPVRTMLVEHKCEEPLPKAWLDLSPCTPPPGDQGDDVPF